MFTKAAWKFILILGLLLRPYEQTTTVETWLTIPDYCLNPWESLEKDFRMSLYPTLNMCLSNAFAFADCRGVQCSNGTSLCEGITWTQSVNKCFGPLKAPKTSKLIIKEDYVISRDQDVFIFYGSTFQINGVSVTNMEPIHLPELAGNIVPVLYNDGMVVCDGVSRSCYRWQQGSDDWSPFPSMKKSHNKGSLSNVGGKLLAMGGLENSSPTKFIEIFDGTNWIELPQLEKPRRAFATVVINSTSIALIGGYNQIGSSYSAIGSDFALFHVDTEQWTIMDDYPHKQAALSCCNFDNGSMEGIFCIGGVGDPVFSAPPQQAFLFDWNTNQWTRVSQFDIITEEDYVRGPIFQLKNTIYYKPQATMPGNLAQEKILKIDTNATSPAWTDLMLDYNGETTEALFLTTDSYTIIA